MSGGMRITFLGTGTSVGVPMIGCDCATCTSTDPHDKRCRSSIYVETAEMSWVVDTGPDFRYQCLRAGILKMDAAVYTHAHMDHVTGFDELRRFTIPEDHWMPIYARPATLAVLERMFDYAFNGENRYRGYLKPFPKPIHGRFHLGETTVTPLPVRHGKVETVGYLLERAGKKLCAYIPDAKELSAEAMDAIAGVDTLIIDALRRTPHPTHLVFDESLAIVDVVQPREAWFTHFTCEIRHAVEDPTLPEGIHLAYDGLVLEWP